MSEARGAIVAAIIAGLVAFYSLIISKEQTVSNFRQHWIDQLRKDIAAVVACVSGIKGASIAKRKDDNEQSSASVETYLTQLNEVIARIRLRLNPKEKRKKEGPATKAVLEALQELESIFVGPETHVHGLQPLVTKLVTNAQVILKENWERVRSGEKIYQLTKWITLVLTVAVVIAALIHTI